MKNSSKNIMKFQMCNIVLIGALSVFSAVAKEKPKPGEGDDNRPERPNRPELNELDNTQQRLQELLTLLEITSIDETELNLPRIDDPITQLGKKLFFAKNLGGEQSVACVSCHHPVLGGGDDISLSVGVSPVNEINQASHGLLGHGRFNGLNNDNLPSIPRNAPTIFNLGLNNRAMFWDGRVEMRRNNRIVTPDSIIGENGRPRADRNLPENSTLAAAQARFPLNSPEEMRGEFLSDKTDDELRAALVNRFTNMDEAFPSVWPNEFNKAFGDDEVNIDRISHAIGEYERSMLFVNSPWQQYLLGNESALTDEQKAGALLFFSPTQEGGAGCSGCHQGSEFTGFRYQMAAYPQFGPGKGNESTTSTSQDFGRENTSKRVEERFHFRTSSLLNVEVTAPYGHTGAYQTLEEVVRHYNNPRESIDLLFGMQDTNESINESAPFCQLSQISDLMVKNSKTCAQLYPNAYANSVEVTDYLELARDEVVETRFALRGRRNLNDDQITRVVSFLKSLTDPCVKDRNCLSPWILEADEELNFPDPLPLKAHDKNSSSL